MYRAMGGKTVDCNAARSLEEALQFVQGFTEPYCTPVSFRESLEKVFGSLTSHKGSAKRGGLRASCLVFTSCALKRASWCFRSSVIHPGEFGISSVLCSRVQASSWALSDVPLELPSVF